MAKHLPEDLLDPNRRHSGTPTDLVIRTEARKPATKATLDIDVPVVAPARPSKHRLVTLGDSLSMGFQSLGTANTAICWPRIVAWELGLDDRDFVTPTLGRYGGMPFNLEFLLRELERHVDDLQSVSGGIRAAFLGVDFYQDVARFWGTEWDRNISPKPVHNLASWGWDIADLQQVTASFLRQEVEASSFYPTSAAARSAYRVLCSARRPGEREGTLTPVEAAQAFGEDGGIETLVVMIGANNALRSVIELEVTWTDDSGAHRDPHGKQQFTVWHPKHFREELARLVSSLGSIKAENVILSTVPHVTVPPVTRGITPGSPGSKVTASSRYFEFYARPWVEAFDYRDDPCLTAGQARAIDSAIDDYNDAIETAVRQKRSEGKQWFLLETAGLLDRLASRRYLAHPAARPSWWDSVGGAYPLPEPLARLGVDSRFFLADTNGRTQGGLFSLDGVHPTTIGYGLIAQEVMNVMHLAGVKFRLGNGALRPGPVAVDFDRLLRLDTLMAAPPRLTAGLLGLLRTLDERSEGVLQKLAVAV